MRQIHIANAGGRDATVTFATPKVPPTPKPGVPGHEIEFRRYMVATPETLDDALVKSLGEPYGDQLIAGDPEVDIEQVGRRWGLEPERGRVASGSAPVRKTRIERRRVAWNNSSYS